MCGIYGNMSSDKIDPVVFESHLKTLNHRGPDDFGSFYDNNVALGHTRLSILDLSPLGHQPMVDRSNRYIIVFNGEIYNFREIRKELELKGCVFKSNTDTEVVLYGFIVYKEQIANKLNGMFAFTIYDSETKEFFLARDSFGMKPLYYINKGGDFHFSSEAKTLRKYSSDVNIDAKVLFMLLGSIPEPMTYYKGVEMLPAGHYAFFKKGQNNLKPIRFYSLEYLPKIRKPYNEIVKDTRGLLERAVQRHMISDAPLGVFLSGGLDSSVLTAIASNYSSQVNTLSLFFGDEVWHSEEVFQDEIAKKYNTKHTKAFIDEKFFLESLDGFFAAMDAPTIDGINTHIISKAATKIGLKAVLSGLGADEIFYGYPSFKKLKLKQVLASLPHSFLSVLSNYNKFEKQSSMAQIDSDLRFYLPGRGIFSIKEISSYCNVSGGYIYNLIAELYEQEQFSNTNSLEDKISQFETTLYMRNQLLRDSDIFGMANSLEIRVPFLDKELVEYVLKLDPSVKMDSKLNKKLLVDSVKDLIPSSIYDRPKMGFALPFKIWFDKNINEYSTTADIKDPSYHWYKEWSKIVLTKFDERK